MGEVVSALDLSEEQRDVLRRAEKLLRLASGTTHPEERESAERKVADLLLAYNLSASAIGSGDDGRRAQEKLAGGFYRYERTLWRWVAEVNFCLHWHSQDYVERPPEDARRRKVRERYSGFAQQYRKVTRQHLVGRAINVEATKFQVSYLREAIERELRVFLFGSHAAGAERLIEGAGTLMRSERATNFREGAADQVATRLWRRRQDQEAEETAKRRAEEALRTAGSGGDGTGTALTISDVRQTERDANMDVLYGDGWSAKQRSERAAQAAALRAAEEEWTKWAAANPEEARAEEKRRREEERKDEKRRSRVRGATSRSRVSDWGAYSAGADAGDRIGLDPQATHAAAPRMLSRGGER